MKAVVQDRYGPPEVLHIGEIDRPVPKGNEVLIRVRAASVSQSDAHARAAHPFLWRLVAGFRKPRWPFLGTEMAGEIEAVGSGVTEFRVGERVFGTPRAFFGTHAELICLPETAPIAEIPPGVTFEEAAAICDGGGQALATLRKAEVGAGSRVVIYGASGSLGTAAVQIAHHLGAHVTGVCNTNNVELVRSLGADDVVDYTKEDFTKRGLTYDAIIDAVGKYAFLRGRRALRPGGIHVATDMGRSAVEAIGVAILSRWIGTKRVRFASGRRNRDDVRYLGGLVSTGAYHPVVDRTYPLEEVAEAHRYVDSWQKTGNVVLLISPVAAEQSTTEH